jgi:hypothetical protein
MRIPAFLFLVLVSGFFWFAPRRPYTPTTPLPPQIRELVYGNTHSVHSALWLLALGVPRLSIAEGGKYEEILERGSDNTYQVPVRNPGPAILVSRYQWKRLPRLQSLYDRHALAAYVNWANRPEAAGFRWTSRRRAEVRADLGPDDMILVRHYAAGWRASVPTRQDPIGYLVLDPPSPGPVTITLTAPVFTPTPAVLPTHIVPRINPGGVAFLPDGIISIFGYDLGETGRTRVTVDGRQAEVLWAGEYQVNARLPRDVPPTPEVQVEVHP